MPSATLAQFAAANRRFTVTCTAPGCEALQRARNRSGAVLWATALIRAGCPPGLTLAELKPRLRCGLCGARGQAVLDVSDDGPPPMGMKDPTMDLDDLNRRATEAGFTWAAVVAAGSAVLFTAVEMIGDAPPEPAAFALAIGDDCTLDHAIAEAREYFAALAG